MHVCGRQDRSVVGLYLKNQNVGMAEKKKIECLENHMFRRAISSAVWMTSILFRRGTLDSRGQTRLCRARNEMEVAPCSIL